MNRARWVPPLLCAAAIFALSSRHWSLPVAGTAAEILAKGAHLVEYGSLGASIAWALEPRLGRRALMAGVLLAVIYGATDEFHQGFVPGRDSSLTDLVPDGIGALLGIAALETLRWARRKRIARSSSSSSSSSSKR